MENYIKGIFNGVSTLLTGMKVTGKEFFTKKVTEQYPENRASLKMYDRFRGTLKMNVDENGKLKCIACGLCQLACPNQTIEVVSKMVNDEQTGKNKKVLVKYVYDLGSCMFCQLCVNACPAGAIEFDQAFEHAVFTRSTLIKELDKTATISNKSAKSEDNNINIK